MNALQSIIPADGAMLTANVHPLSAPCTCPWERPMRIYKAVIAEDEPALRAELLKRRSETLVVSKPS